jgi:hypothetical protein
LLVHLLGEGGGCASALWENSAHHQLTQQVTFFVAGKPLRLGDCKHFLVGKIRLGVVALPLDSSRKATSVVSADEQVDPNERMLGVHVAKGGLHEKMLDASPFKSPAAMWFFNP